MWAPLGLSSGSHGSPREMRKASSFVEILVAEDDSIRRRRDTLLEMRVPGVLFADRAPRREGHGLVRNPDDVGHGREWLTSEVEVEPAHDDMFASEYELECDAIEVVFEELCLVKADGVDSVQRVVEDHLGACDCGRGEDDRRLSGAHAGFDAGVTRVALWLEELVLATRVRKVRDSTHEFIGLAREHRAVNRSDETAFGEDLHDDLQSDVPL